MTKTDKWGYALAEVALWWARVPDEVSGWHGRQWRMAMTYVDQAVFQDNWQHMQHALMVIPELVHEMQAEAR